PDDGRLGTSWRDPVRVADISRAAVRGNDLGPHPREQDGECAEGRDGEGRPAQPAGPTVRVGHGGNLPSGIRPAILPAPRLAHALSLDCGTGPRLRQTYHVAMLRYGRHFSVSVVSFLGSGKTLNRYNSFTPIRSPRSPTGSTSGRPNPNIRIISTVHGPIPLIAVSWMRIVSSSRSAIPGSRSGFAPTCSHTARSVRRFGAETPHERKCASVSRASFSRATGGPPSAAVSFAEIEVAALVAICWAMTPRTSRVNGSSGIGVSVHGPTRAMRPFITGHLRERCRRALAWSSARVGGAELGLVDMRIVNHERPLTARAVRGEPSRSRHRGGLLLHQF